MSWNHRVLAKQFESCVYFQIHEVYYDENGKPNAYTDEPIKVGAESIKGINWTLNKMKQCLKKPILWYGEKFPAEYNSEIENNIGEKNNV